MIPSARIDGEFVYVPVLECDYDVKLKIDDIQQIAGCSLRSNICFDEAWRSEDDLSSCIQLCEVFEVKDEEDNQHWFLIVFDEFKEIEGLVHSVAIPYNKFNLVKFYKDYLMAFEDKFEKEE